MRLLNSAIWLLILAVLQGCATHAKTIVVNPVITRIAIIPATNPTWYSFENVGAALGIPLVYLGAKIDSHGKAKIVNDKLNSPPLNLGDSFTEQVAAALRSYGFTVEVLQGVPRPADDPDNVDYDKVHTDADAILHLSISEVGLFSSQFSLSYIPRVNAAGKLFVKGGDDNLYDEEIYYGVDAKKGKAWAIVPDARFQYRTFDAVMANIDEIRSSFTIGVSEISKRMAEQIKNAIAH